MDIKSKDWQAVSSKLDALWAQVNRLEEGQDEAALDIFLQIVEADPYDLKALQEVGWLLMKLDQHNGAVPYFKTAVQLAPEDELTSCGYFFSLRHSIPDRIVEALEEAQRFINIKGYTKTYRKILKELKELKKIA